MSGDAPQTPPGVIPVQREISEQQLIDMGKPFFDAVDALRKAGHDRFTALAAIQYAAGAMMAHAGIFIAQDPQAIAQSVAPLLHGWRTGRAMMDEEARQRSH